MQDDVCGQHPLNSLPLQNCRVVELGSGAALALCGKFFADFGAEVIKIEPPGGDGSRHRSPLIDVGDGQRENPYFAWLNTNKTSVTARLDDTADVERVRELIGQCDILLDGRLPCDATSADLSHDSLQLTTPALTIAGLSWFGQDGPYRDFAMTDAVCRALAGLVNPIGPKDKPLAINDHISEVVGGLTAFSAAVSGLLSKVRGRRFDTSIFEANVVLAESHTARGKDGPRLRGGINRFSPSSFPTGIYRCRDGWLGVAAYMYPQWREFCEMFGMKEALANRAYGDFSVRAENAETIEPMFRDQLIERDAVDWFEEARRRRLAFMVTPTVSQLLNSDIHRDNGVFADVEIGTARFEGTVLPLNLTATPPKAGGIAPRAGSGKWAFRDQQDSYFSKPAAVQGNDAGQGKGKRREELPLAGIRIIDLSMGWAGPLVTRMAADLGAEIIKVEACTYADWWRFLDANPVTYSEKLYEKRGGFQFLNHNKLGITLDLATPEGIALVKKLIAGADAVVQNYSREVLPKLGLGYESLKAIKNDIVLLSMAAFRDGPWADTRAYGAGLEQASALPTIAGEEGSVPVMTHYAHGDPIGGLHGSAALLLALLHKKRTGQGQHIDLSLVETMMTMTAPWIVEQSAIGELRPRLGNRHHDYAPHNCFRCNGSDDWIFIAATDDAMWVRLCVAIGRSDLASGDTATLARRQARQDEIEAILAGWSRDLTADDAMDRLQAAGVAAGVVRSPQDLEEDRQLVARGFWQTCNHAFLGHFPQPSPPFREHGVAYSTRNAAPTIGQHNDYVLGDILGLSRAEIEELERKGVIGTEALPPKRTKAAAALNDPVPQRAET